MARMSIEELYCGEGGGAKYGVGGMMCALMQEIGLQQSKIILLVGVLLAFQAQQTL